MSRARTRKTASITMVRVREEGATLSSTLDTGIGEHTSATERVQVAVAVAVAVN